MKTNDPIPKHSQDAPRHLPRPRAPTTGTLVGTRFQSGLLDAVDEWRKQQADLPTRPEAVRRLVELGMNFESSAGKESEKQ